MPQTTIPTRPHFSILATSFAGGPPPRRTATIVFGLWFLLFFAALFSPPLLDDADATHAQAARAMAASGDLVTLHVNGVRYLEKAPLPYWLAALSFKLFGFDTFAAHLPQALAVLLLALLGYRWANQAFGSRTGFYTALGVLTSVGVFLFTRVLIPEVLLSLTLGAALFAFLKSLGPVAPPAPNHLTAFRRHPERGESPTHLDPATPIERPSLAWYAGPLFYPCVLWASLALAVLAKGLVALVFFFATAVAFMLLTGETRNWRKLRPFSGLLLFLAIAAPWHILAGLRNPAPAGGHGFWWFYFYNEHVLRFLGRRIPADYNRMPGWLYWTQHLLWLFPWSLFLPLGITALYRRLKHQQLLTGPITTPGAPGLASETWDGPAPNPTSIPPKLHHPHPGTPGAPSFPASPERVGSHPQPKTTLLHPTATPGAPGLASETWDGPAPKPTSTPAKLHHHPTTNPGAPGLASETWAEPAPKPTGIPAKLHLLPSLLILSTIYPLTKFTGVAPLTLLLLEGVAALLLLVAIQRRRAGLTASPFHRIDPQQRTLLLLSLFAAIVLLFFSLSTNQEYYTFPAYLPLLLLTAATITRAEQTYSTNPSAVRWVNFAHAAFTAIGWLAALALLYGLWSSRHLPYTPDLGQALAHRGIGSYTLATSHLFDLTTESFAGLRLPAVLAALALIFGPPAAWAMRTQRRHLAATTTIAFTAAAFLVAAQLAFARFGPILSSRDFAAVIARAPATTPVLLFGDQSYGSSIPFYLGRPVQLVDGRTSSMQFGSTYPDVPPGTFLTRAQLQALWSQPARILLFVPAERREEALHLLPPNPAILHEQSNKLLLTNHPPP